jgi:HSP20 family protein
MWLEACELLERAEQLQRQFFRLGSPGARLAWEPPVDVFETEAELAVLIALPGVDPAGAEVGLGEGGIVVSGEIPLPAALRTAAIHRLEIPYGRFERRIELPPGGYRLVRHEYLNGCLLLRLEKL